MKVAMVSEHASPLAPLGGHDAGGQNVHVAALAEAMGRRGVEVVVHTRRDDPSLFPRVTVGEAGVAVEHLDAGPPRAIPKDELLPYMDDFADQLAHRWRGEPPDIVHSHFWMSGYAALRAAAALGIPVVHTFHALGVVKRRYQGDGDTSPLERMEIERDVARRVDRVVATCTDEAFELVRIGASNQRLAVVPSGVDTSLFRPYGPAEPRGPRRYRIVCLGRLVERKGIGNVVSALAMLPDTELVVAGGPDREEVGADPDARRLRDLAEAAGVSHRVELRGRLGRNEIPRLLRSADVVVSVPWYEPFGIVPLEAMACGVPVMASAVGGMIDTVVDGVCGLHVPPRDPERLAAALRPLLEDRERRAAYGCAGAERARLYDWDRIAAATLDVYARLGRRRPRSRGSMSAAGRFALPPTGAEHLQALIDSLQRLEGDVERLDGLGQRLAERLLAGHRLLVAGNGGSAAQAQHLTAELVGRYQTERAPLSAICLHSDGSSLTAIGNDYGPEEVFARQVRGHGREGDILMALSTSGASKNVLAAVRAAREAGLETWALTGAAPNPVAESADEAICLPAPVTATVQELHLVALHAICAAVDREVALRTGASPREAALV